MTLSKLFLLKIERKRRMSQLGFFIWGTADILRGPYKASQYGNVVLPITILRRLDCVLEEHRTTIEPLVERFGSNPELLSAQVQRATGLPFYDTSPWRLKTLLGDPKGIEANLKHYANGFSDNMDVFERFKLADEIATMAEKNILYIVVERFSNIDLHPKTVTNAEISDLYEYLIRTFNESSNEAPGEHFTSRDAIRLLVDLVFAGDDEAMSPRAPSCRSMKLSARLGYKVAAQSRWLRKWFKTGGSGSIKVQDIIDEGTLCGRRNKKVRGCGDQRRETADQRRLRVRHSGVSASVCVGS